MRCRYVDANTQDVRVEYSLSVAHVDIHIAYSPVGVLWVTNTCAP
jgi:hypothetical protein